MAIAQRRTFPTRAELDSLVNPTLSTKSIGILKAKERHKNIGTIGTEELIRVSFTLENATTTPITITELHSSCSCLKVTTKPSTLEPSEAITIEATFNPEGRNGEFSQNILVYTNTDTLHPTERLTVKGVVKNSDEWLHLPKHMGILRMSRKEVTVTSDGEERIAVANTSTSPLRLQGVSTLEGLTLRTNPEVIEAGEEADIWIAYRGTETDITTMIVVEGITGRASDRVIKVTIKR